MPIQAAQFSRMLRAATRLVDPIRLVAQAGALVVFGDGGGAIVESPDLSLRFVHEDVDGLLGLLRGRTEDLTVGDGPALVVGNDQLDVGTLERGFRLTFGEPTLTCTIERARLRTAVERYARRDARVLLEHRDGELRIVDVEQASVLSTAVREGPPVLARAVSARALRRLATHTRSERLELQIFGQWNGEGPMTIMESEEIGGFRLTRVLRGGSYKEVRRLLQERAEPAQPEAVQPEAVQPEAVLHECRLVHDPEPELEVDARSVTLWVSCQSCPRRVPVSVARDQLDERSGGLDLRDVSRDYMTRALRKIEAPARVGITTSLAKWIQCRREAGFPPTVHQLLGLLLCELADSEPIVFAGLLGVEVGEPPAPPSFSEEDLLEPW